MPSINGIVSEHDSRSHCKKHNLKDLYERESVIRWNLTCWHIDRNGMGVS